MIYVLSDIHGHLRRFEAILAKIGLMPEDTLYVLGDVIDRHPEGIEVLRRIMAMPNARMIPGNHEYMMLRALGHPLDSNTDDGNALAHWYRNGGKVTHDSWQQLSEGEQKEIVEYLHRLPLTYEVAVKGWNYRLVHATVQEHWDDNEDLRYLTRTHFAVWKRLDIRKKPLEDATLIFGHTPTVHYQEGLPMELYWGEGLIGIDCGCGYPDGTGEGRLACLRLDDGAVFYAEDVYA